MDVSKMELIGSQTVVLTTHVYELQTMGDRWVVLSVCSRKEYDTCLAVYEEYYNGE